MLSREIGVAEVGIYYLATRLTFLLGGTLLDVGTSVAFPIYSRLQEDRDEAVRIFRAVLSASAAVIAPAFIMLAAIAPALVDNVLGPRWQGTETVIQVMALVCVASLFGDTSAPIWRGMGQPWRNALLELLQASVLLAGVWWLASSFGAVGAALAWLPATALTQLLSAIFLPRVLPHPTRGLVPLTFAIAGCSVFGAGVAWAGVTLWPGLAGTLAAAILGGTLSLGSLWWCDRRLDLGLERSLQRVFPGLPLPGARQP